MDTAQVVTTIYKSSETLRTYGRAATELYEQLSNIQEGEISQDEAHQLLAEAVENSKRLAIFAWYQAKQQDEEAKEYATKALKLPASLKHLETKPSGKKEAFSPEFLEQYNEAAYQQRIIQAATGGNNGYGGSSRGGYSNQWSQHNRGGRGFAREEEKTSLRDEDVGLLPSTTTTILTTNNNNQLSDSNQQPWTDTINLKSISTPPPHTQLQQRSSQPTKNYDIPKDGIPPGGRLRQFINYWKSITSHPWPISVIQQGYKIQFAKRPVPWKTKPKQFSTEDQLHVNIAIQKFLKGEMIEVSPSQNKSYLSKFFTLQEQTKRRSILDCQKLNSFIQVEHFKMEGVPALRDIIEENDYICKIDLKDAYVVVPIHPDSQDYLSFENQGTVYRYKSLAFGLSIAPRVFSETMKYAIEPLRKEGHRLVYYLDDICLLEKSKEKMNTLTNRVTTHFQNLGFIINYNKSMLTPTKTQDFLGFQFNTKKMEISVPTLKINNLLKRLKQLTAIPQRSCRWIASLLGKMTSMIPAIGEALLHIRYIQRDLSRTLHMSNQNWETTCKLSSTSLEELQWWEQFILKKNGLPIQKIIQKNPKVVIHVDASNTGWGVSSPMVTTAGFWTNEEIQQSINVRELKTILFAIQLHAKNCENSTIKIFSDNITALKYTVIYRLWFR